MLLIARPMDSVDHAAVREAADRAEAVRRVQAELAEAGAPDCASCGDAIEPSRRAAMPSATRCLPCQARREHTMRPRAAIAMIGAGL